jgi:lipopolysaccharide/colanic/teichoic acid biosynthesis glycosyltransferase
VPRFFRRFDLSYGTYVYGWPVGQVVLGSLGPDTSPWMLATITLPVTFAFAFISWTLVEEPFMRLKPASQLRLHSQSPSAVLESSRILERPAITGTTGYALVKRLMDVVGAACLLVVTALVLAIALAAVWMDSGRPLFHRRRVVGVGGREFDAFKVRTMVVDADQILASDPELHHRYAANNKLRDDPRTTRVGRWLRQLSIDELPQMINVLRGEMSLVGPRMINQNELSEWGDTAPLILSVRPGITGTWQVSGRQRLTKADRVRMDSEYVNNLSLRQDMSVLLRTIPAVLFRTGAY